MDKPVFVLTTSKTCHSCHNFKKNVWSNLRRDLEHEKKVRVVTIDVINNNSKPSPEKYHPDLKRYIGWFPTMSLFPASSWRDKSSKLRGVIKDGKIVPAGHDDEGNYKPEHVDFTGKVNLSKDSILDWIDDTLEGNRLFNSSYTGKNSIVITNGGKPLSENMIVPTYGHFFKHSKVK